MKKVIFLAIGAFVLLAAYWSLEGFADAMLNHRRRRPNPQLSLSEIARQNNANLPRQLDNDTRLDREIAGPGNRMTYQCTLVNIAAADINIAKFAARVTPLAIQRYRNTPGLERYRARQVELNFEYHDKTGKLLTNIVVSPKDF